MENLVNTCQYLW